jgi:hypothetical protein
VTVTWRDAATLPVHDEYGCCPKCGGHLGTTYHAEAECDDNKATRGPWPCFDVVAVHGEHLCRVCARCGWGRAEQTAEQSADRPKRKKKKKRGKR